MFAAILKSEIPALFIQCTSNNNMSENNFTRQSDVHFISDVYSAALADHIMY